MTPTPQPMKVVMLEVTAEQYAALSLLAKGGDPRSALMELIWRVMDGVRRPGAWERAWLEKVFWHGWQHELEPDPDAPWRVRVPPKRRRRRWIRVSLLRSQRS